MHIFFRMSVSATSDTTQYNRLVETLSPSSDDPPSTTTPSCSRAQRRFLPLFTYKEPSSKTLTLLAYLPVVYAIIAACIATGAPPTYFNTRHLVLLPGVFGAWIVSHGITLFTTNCLSHHFARYQLDSPQSMAGFTLDLNGNPSPDIENLHSRMNMNMNRNDKPHRPLKISLLLYLLTLKNIILGLTPAVLLANITCGIFSTCESWTPILGPGTGGVALNPVGDFERNAVVWYPWLTGSVLVVQLGWAGFLILGSWLGLDWIGS